MSSYLQKQMLKGEGAGQGTGMLCWLEDQEDMKTIRLMTVQRQAALQATGEKENYHETRI